MKRHQTVQTWVSTAVLTAALVAAPATAMAQRAVPRDGGSSQTMAS